MRVSEFAVAARRACVGGFEQAPGEDLAQAPRASIHVQGPAYDVQTSDGSRVGYNDDTTVAFGDEITYHWRAPDREGIYFFRDNATLAGSEADGGSSSHGLYGAFVVRGDAEPATTTDRTVVLDDLLVDSNWQLSDFDPLMQAMVGRQGNVILANGWAHPIAGVARGGLHRFRFINAANARPSEPSRRASSDSPTPCCAPAM